MLHANNKGADQPSTSFAFHCSDSIIRQFAKSKILRLLLVSVAELADLNLIWSQSPEDRFARDVALISKPVSFSY